MNVGFFVFCFLFFVLPKTRYGTEFKFYIYLVLLENQLVIHSFANGMQPSSHKQSSDVTGMVLVLLVGRTFLAVLTNELEVHIAHTDMKTQEQPLPRK